MDIEHAKKIINSSSLINVHYDGTPVFIQQIHEDTQMATVFPLNQMTHKQVVDLKELTETKTLMHNGGVSMNKQRAKEISQAPDMKHVTYNGEQVYIQHVNKERNTARIHSLDDPENEFDVQIESLQEEVF